jgi:endonuclease/exonuclease/phosphatase family metal-dependent hydrolase
MKIIRPLLYLLLVLAGAFLLFLVYATIDDFRPQQVIVESADCEKDILSDSMQVRLLIWNIGYAGLDAGMDFFYDGGEQMRPAKEQVIKNMEGILRHLETYRNVDFILLQEVDQDSKRSYHINEYQEIKDRFPGYTVNFGTNYQVGFVPIPLKEPMGKVRSGLMTLSLYCPERVERHGFPGNYSWPVKLFMLDRCFLVNRYRLANEKELVIINTHNSAYDDGTLRAQQMDFLRDYLTAEYEKGNFVMVGGDWNQTPYGIAPELPSHRFDTENLTYIEKDYPAPGWTWAYDPDLPTNRRVAIPFDRAASPTTIIDCYLLSPNINVDHVETIDLDFKHSDHHPVRIQATLSSNP